MERQKFSCLTENSIKYIIIVAMTIDHIGWIFVELNSPLGQIMHLVGRFTAPMMCYFAAEGFNHTHDLGKYVRRLGIFALISHIPYVIMENLPSPPIFLIDGGGFQLNSRLLYPHTSVIFTILLGVIALAIIKCDKFSNGLKIAAVAIILFLSGFTDWSYFGVFWIIFFGLYRNDLKKQLISYYAVAVFEIIFILINRNFNFVECIWQLGILIAPIFILLYNGKRGSGKPFHKWFFYIYYPLHMAALSAIMLFMIYGKV